VREPIPRDTLEYVRLFLSTLLLVLLVPLTLAHLWLEPREAAGKAIGGAVK
jgi:hypothetical protein